MSTLPRELWDFIIDELALDKSNSQTLRALSLAARAFHERTSRYLFASVHIMLHTPGLSTPLKTERIATLRKFHEVLRDSLAFPALGLAYNLRQVALVLRERNNECCSIIEEGYLGQTIDALHGPDYGIESFSFTIYPSQGYKIDFCKLDNTFRRAFIGMCQSPYLRNLKLGHFSDLPRSLIHGTSIRHIDFNFDEFSPTSSAEAIMITQLESITVRDRDYLTTLQALHSGGGTIDRTVRYKAAFARLTTLQIVISYAINITEALEIAKLASDTLDTPLSGMAT